MYPIVLYLFTIKIKFSQIRTVDIGDFFHRTPVTRYKCITSQIFAHFYEKHHHILHNKDSLGMQPFQPVLTFHMQVYMHIFAPQKT